MFTSSYQRQSLGLYQTSQSAQLVQLLFNKDQITILSASEIPLEEDGDNVKPLYTNNGLSLSELTDAVYTTTALATTEVLIRPLEIGLTKDKNVNAVFQFEAESLLPYALEEAILEKIHLSKSEETTFLTLLSTRKNRLEQHIRDWNRFAIEPEAVSCVPAALALFSTYCLSTENPYIVVHIGHESNSCILVQQGKLIASYSLSDGVSSIEQALSEDLGVTLEKAREVLQDLDCSTITPETMPKTYEQVQQMRLGTVRIIYALCKQVQGQEVSQILVTGYGAALHHFIELLTTELPKEVTIASSTSLQLPMADLNRYAVPLGLALAADEKNPQCINFRQAEFSFPHPWKRIKKPLTALVSLALTCALLFYCFGQLWMGYQEDQLKEKYGNLIASQYKSLEAFEEEYRKKAGLPPTMQENNELYLRNLSSQDIAERLNYLHNSLTSTPETFPLQPNTPRVSDVLAWLSSHPNVVKESEEGAEPQPLLYIENFTYSMVKRPEQTKKQEKYQVKVELDFTSPTPKLAREFHDALIAPNDFVDPKAEVKWSANKGKYHTSFFLKDKTAYISMQGGK